MTDTVSVFKQPKAARSSVRYTVTLRDENSAGIPAASMFDVKLSLYNADTGQVINGISAVSILNTGRGTLDVAGKLVVTLGPADTVMSGSPDPGTLQYRSMVIDYLYNGGTSQGRHQIDFPLEALAEA